MGRKREGYVMIVLILIFLVLPAIIMVATATTGNFKSIIANKEYHQLKLDEMSMEEVGLQGVEEAIQSISLLINQEVIVVEGVEVKGAYYIEEAKDIDMMKIKALIEGKDGVKDQLEMSTLMVEGIQVESNYAEGKMELPYAVEQTIRFKLQAEGLAGLLEQNLVLAVSYILDVGADGLLMIRDLSVTD